MPNGTALLQKLKAVIKGEEDCQNIWIGMNRTPSKDVLRRCRSLENAIITVVNAFGLNDAPLREPKFRIVMLADQN